MSKMKDVKVKLLDEKAIVPTKAHDTDTGYDLTFTGVKKIEGDVIFFKTDIAIQPPAGYYFEVAPRSSISKYPLSMANSIGIIDETYTGEILVAVRVLHSEMGHNNERNSYPNGLISIFGRRPASMHDVGQLILQNQPKMFQLVMKQRIEVNFMISDGLENTVRADGGFGSSDKK